MGYSRFKIHDRVVTEDDIPALEHGNESKYFDVGSPFPYSNPKLKTTPANSDYRVRCPSESEFSRMSEP